VLRELSRFFSFTGSLCKKIFGSGASHDAWGVFLSPSSLFPSCGNRIVQVFLFLMLTEETHRIRAFSFFSSSDPPHFHFLVFFPKTKHSFTPFTPPFPAHPRPPFFYRDLFSSLHPSSHLPLFATLVPLPHPSPRLSPFFCDWSSPVLSPSTFSCLVYTLFKCAPLSLRVPTGNALLHSVYPSKTFPPCPKKCPHHVPICLIFRQLPQQTLHVSSRNFHLQIPAYNSVFDGRSIFPFLFFLFSVSMRRRHVSFFEGGGPCCTFEPLQSPFP